MYYIRLCKPTVQLGPSLVANQRLIPNAPHDRPVTHIGKG